MELATLFLLSGAFMGWSNGANDAANVFGTAVGTRVVKYRTAIILTAIFAVAGAATGARNVVGNIGSYAARNGVDSGLVAFLIMLVAASVVTLMTIVKAPVSTSQSLIGCLVGWGLSQGTADWSRTSSFFSAWIISPISTMFITLALCWVAERFIEKRVKGLAAYDTFIKVGYIVAGIFGAYSLGANSAANATGVYLHVGIFEGPAQAVSNLLGVRVSVELLAALLGGLTMAVGVLTFSKRIMLAVGEGITKLSPLNGFLVVFSCSIVVCIFSLIGYSISTSQAVVGAVMGAGFSKGHRGVDFKVLGRIFVAWFGTPTLAGLLCYLIGVVFFK